MHPNDRQHDGFCAARARRPFRHARMRNPQRQPPLPGCDAAPARQLPRARTGAAPGDSRASCGAARSTARCSSARRRRAPQRLEIDQAALEPPAGAAHRARCGAPADARRSTSSSCCAGPACCASRRTDPEHAAAGRARAVRAHAGGAGRAHAAREGARLAALIETALRRAGAAWSTALRTRLPEVQARIRTRFDRARCCELKAQVDQDRIEQEIAAAAAALRRRRGTRPARPATSRRPRRTLAGVPNRPGAGSTS